MYLILQVILLRWLVIFAGLPVELDHKPAILLAGLALVAEQAQQVFRTGLAVSVSAVALCMCTRRDGQSAQRASRGAQNHLTPGKPVRRVLTSDISRQPGLPQRLPEREDACGCLEAGRARVLLYLRWSPISQHFSQKRPSGLNHFLFT
jgi:hypothetical protein